MNTNAGPRSHETRETKQTRAYRATLCTSGPKGVQGSIRHVALPLARAVQALNLPNDPAVQVGVAPIHGQPLAVAGLAVQGCAPGRFVVGVWRDVDVNQPGVATRAEAIDMAREA